MHWPAVVGDPQALLEREFLSAMELYAIIIAAR